MESKPAKKPGAAAPGKKKVIRRLVKNAKTGEIIKTEIVRIDSSGERTVTSYPAGTPVPSLSSLQASSSQVKKSSSTKKVHPEEAKVPPAASPVRPRGRDEDSRPSIPRPRSSSKSPPRSEAKKLPRAYEEINNKKLERADVGPSVPANVPGLEDLIRKEEELRRATDSGLDKHEKGKGAKEGEESLETALISIMKRKRQRDPKARRRGLVASTMPKKSSDDEVDKALDDAYVGDTDYRSMSSKKEETAEDEEEERRRKERHRRRREKRMKEKAQDPSDNTDKRDDVEEYQGETGPLDMPIESSKKRPEEETPMEQAPPEGQEDSELAEKMEGASLKADAEADTQPIETKEDEDSGDDDDKKKKKKKKHKKKKKKHKKQKKRSDQSGSDRERGRKRGSRSKTRSRTRSLSSLSLSSISSTFSDNFDFAGMNFDPSEDGAFDMALMEYQAMRGQVMPGPFHGPGFDPYFFRGHGNFRGFPRGRARGQMFPWPGRGGRGGFFPYFPGDPNFFPFPGAEGEGGDASRGRGQRGLPLSRGPWRGRGLRGRGIPPGFHRNYTEDDAGGCVYVENSSSSGSSGSGKKKKKKKHKRKSYSSRSYSSSDSHSSRSRSRSRRHRRRRHRSSSYSSYSRSSRSYSRSSYSSRSRSYSRSSRSSRSYSRSSSRSSSRSRSNSRSSRKDHSRSGSQRRDENAKPWGWDGEGGGGRASPSYRAYGGDEDGFRPPVRAGNDDDEEVPWWAEFDKTYEVEKKKQEEEKKKQEDEEKKKDEEEEVPAQSIVSTEEIDVVRCMMSLVDKAYSQQDEAIEASRECINDMINQISATPVQATQLHEESKDPFEKIIHDCVDSILDKVCPNDPQTAARSCLKEIIDTVVEQEEEDKATEEATEMEKEITESEQTRLFQCYLRAQTLTEQIRIRKAKEIADDAEKGASEKPKSDDRRRDRKGHRSRHRRRSRSRSRDRGRRRRRGRSSSDSRSRSSSRSSERRVPLVSKESLQQAQAMLLMQQQQLQVAGLLGTGMPNLAGLTQAAALAAGIKPADMPKPESAETAIAEIEDKENQSKFTKWDKDKDAMLKTKSKDDLTRKLMQRMKEKKLQQGDEGDLSPTFLGRNKEKGAEATAEKVFTGPGLLKGRKIAISSNFAKLWSKVEGSPKHDEDGQDGVKLEARSGYNKSDIVAATTDSKDQAAIAEKLKAEEQEKKLAAWSDQQAKLKEEAKREMREQIERAERAKKEKMKEEILEQERQREIMRIREEVRSQIRKEIEEEIATQRKTVLEDPNVREKLLELEALRSQSGMIASEGRQTATSSAQNASTSASQPMQTQHSQQQAVNMQVMRDARWYQQQLKNKQDMQKWMEGHGYYEADMDETQMKRMQLTYMQQWSQPQIQAYMTWYWQKKQQPPPNLPPGYFQQRPMMQRQGTGPPQGSMQQQMPGTDMQGRGHDPSYRGREPGYGNVPQHPDQHRPDGRHGVPGYQNQMGQGRPPHQNRGMPPHVGPMGARGYDQPPRQQPPQYRDERQMYDLQQQQRAGVPPRGQYWHRDHMQGNQQQPATQKQQQPTQQPQAGMKQPPNQGQPPPNFTRGDGPPVHQYPPPGMDEGKPGTAAPRPVSAPDQQGATAATPQGGPLHRPSVDGQPPPPGEFSETSKIPTLRPPVVDDLAPPGEEQAAVVAPGGDESPKSKKKKKQKKHRKHKKKKYSSSEEEETKDPEAEKQAILAQLQHLQDVEDGEIASGDEGIPAIVEPPSPEEAKETKKKKKHKKEKKKHRKKKDDSSDDEAEPVASQQQQGPGGGHLPPPPIPGFFPVPGGAGAPPPGVPPYDQNRQNYGGMPPNEQRNMEFPPHSGAGSFGPPGQREGLGSHQYPRGVSPGRDGHFLGGPPPDRDRQGFLPHHRGSGEPQRIAGHGDPHQHPMGPSGDHNPQRKRSPSPLPLVIPTDPVEYEVWQRKMEARYGDGDTKGLPPRPDARPQDGARPEASLDQQLMKDIEAIRRRQGERGLEEAANDDVLLLMRRMDEEQRRHRPEPGPGHDQPPRRKRGHGPMSRGGRKRRRQVLRKNYHDWDKPEDDGLIYCMSDSGSSGWGSDTNMDFDRMLAKKRREAQKTQDKRDPMPQQRGSPRPDVDMRRNPSPGHMMGWDRPPRNDMPGEKPQGIPVIGGGPRPIPTNVSAGRPTPPHRHPEMLPPSSQGVPGIDYLPQDILKMPQFPPGYPPDPMAIRRDLPPSQIPPGGHPIPRLGGPHLPMPPMMMNPPMHEHMPPNPPGRMHPMDYDKFRPRY